MEYVFRRVRVDTTGRGIPTLISVQVSAGERKGKRVVLCVLSPMPCPLRSPVNRGQAISLFTQFFYGGTANINLSKKLKIIKQPRAQGSWLGTEDLPGTLVTVSSSTPPPKPEGPVGARHCSLAARGTSGSSKEQSRGRGMLEAFSPLLLPA